MRAARRHNDKFDVYVRRVPGGSPLRVTRSAGFDANVSLAVDAQDRLWVSWDEAEPDWGKDWTSLRWRPGGGNGLYRTRAVRIAVPEGGQWRAPAAELRAAIPAEFADYYQMARLVPDRQGLPWALLRSLTSVTTRVQNNWGAGGRYPPPGWGGLQPARGFSPIPSTARRPSRPPQRTRRRRGPPQVSLPGR